MQASQPFQEYAWFSTQVDQYYAAVRIFARHYDALRTAYLALPAKNEWPSDPTVLSESARSFFVTATSSLNYMGTTGIFSEAPFPELANLPDDLINFGFYTCFCFQWTLFEVFVRRSVLALADDGLLPGATCAELRARERRTEQFLRYIDGGHVFGKSPFVTVLPIPAWTPQVETCSFPDLDEIRRQRNEFIHAVDRRSIAIKLPMGMDRYCDRSMWILRHFAEHVDTEIQGIRLPAQPGA